MGILYVVATPIGNLDDISKRVLDTLSNVSLIAAEDTRQTIKILNKFNIKTKMVAYHKYNENQKSESIILDLKGGKNIALVSDAGTPCVSDPGYILIKKAREEGINVIGIPGPSALVTALSISGIDSSHFMFWGFLSTDNKKLKAELEIIKNNEVKTIIFYESPRRIKKTIEKMLEYFPDSIVAICSDMTKIHERVFYGKIEEIYQEICKDANIEKGEYVIVLEKVNYESVVEEVSISLEAMIVDILIKENCSVKEAVNSIAANNKNIKKSDLYNAGLNLKRIIK